LCLVALALAGVDDDIHCAENCAASADSSLLQVKTVRGRVSVKTVGTAARASKAAPAPDMPLPEAKAVPPGAPPAMAKPAPPASSHLVVALQAAAFACFVFYLGSRMAAYIAGRGAAGSSPKDAIKRGAEPTAADDDQAASSDEEDRRKAVIKLGGMTCSACSGAIERCLRRQKGVESVSVNLVLEKATVVFDGQTVTADALCDEIEDIGFVATLVSQGSTVFAEEGHATLHLEAPPELPSDELTAAAEKVEGVVAASALDSRTIRVTYRPQVVGARTVLKRLQELFPKHELLCAAPKDSSLTGDARLHTESLWFNLKCSALPAALVFLMTIVLPGVGRDLGSITCLNWHVDTCTLMVILLSTPVQFVFGREFHTQARKALARRAPNMDVLVSLATSIAFGYAMLILISKVCRAAAGQNVMSYEEMRHGGAMSHEEMLGHHIGLGCHALHFFGMSPILMTVVLCGKYIETKAKIQTMESLTKLMECKSQSAQLVLEDREEAVPAELVHIGDCIRLFEGCQVPVDGDLTSEEPIWVNEAMLTGESAPVEKRRGSVVMGGTTVVSGTGLMRATTVGSKTALGEIMNLISNAQATKTRTQQLAATVSGYFVIAVMAFSFLVFVVWCLLIYRGWVALPPDMDGASAFDIVLFAARFGVAVLMIACPCAMGLATPTAVMVAAGVAARVGCLVKSAEALETGATVKTVVLDKTGTITEGVPRVSGVALSPALAKLPARCLEVAGAATWEQSPMGRLPRPPVEFLAESSTACAAEAARLERAFWRLVGIAEAGSDHPLAKCLTSTAQAVTGSGTFPAAEQFRYSVGRGVSATTDGVDVRIGSLPFLEETARELRQELSADDGLDQLEAWASDRRAARESVVIVFAVVEGKVRLLGALGMRDSLRPDARRTIRYLQQDLGLEVWMCTGDGRKTAQAIAREVGIPEDRVHAEAMPKHKADKVQQLKAALGDGGAVCVVGDGVNDAPALAVGDVGLAIGAGAHLAMDAADVILIRSELATVATYLQLSKDTVFTIQRNFLWAFIFNVCGLPVAAGFFYPRVVLPPLLAGVAMGLSSALVVSSSLMLKRFEPPEVPALEG